MQNRNARQQSRKGRKVRETTSEDQMLGAAKVAEKAAKAAREADPK